MSDVEANKAKIREFYERSDQGDLSVYDEMVAADFVNHGGPAGEIHGPEAFKQAYVGFAAAFSDFTTTTDLMVAEGDYVTVYGVARGTHTGPFMGLPPTGNTLRWTGIAIYKFNADGAIEGRWHEIDALGLMGQLGLLRPPPGGPS